MAYSIPQRIKDMKYHFCAVCGRTDDLQYHHFEPYNGHNTVPENIIVLCAEHHQKWHEQRGAIKHNRLVKDGIAKARERGIRVGKKPAPYEHIMRLIAENSTQFNDINDESYTPKTEHEIMAMAGVKEVCYAKCKRMLFDAMSQDTWPYSWDKPKHAYYRPLYDMQVRKLRGETA